MRTKSIITLSLVAVIAIVGFLVARRAFAKDAPAYRFATVERGNIEATVSATGTLGAVKTVAVGTQVSGQVSKLYVDFNDHVKKGQLLAEIDPTLLQQAVSDAEANVERVRAQLLQAQREYARNRELGRSGLIARSEIETTQSSSAVAAASLKSAQIALQKAQQNLAYANIYAPIDGVVVERNVDEGQTVAASLSAPQLFLIANDLSQMQILAQVGESDIAQIAEGQPVEFTVQALPNQKFKGSVKQVRLQSKTQDNVVNYTVVVSAPNTGGRLRPGMTARTDFLTQSAENVLKVPNAALRYKPAATQTTQTGQAAQTAMRTRSARTKGGTLFYLDETGKVKVARVRTGISDGSSTAVEGDAIREGMKVIAGAASTSTSASPAATPFASGNTAGQRAGGGRSPAGSF